MDRVRHFAPALRCEPQPACEVADTLMLMDQARMNCELKCIKIEKLVGDKSFTNFHDDITQNEGFRQAPGVYKR
jgi:hypothetical protein